LVELMVSVSQALLQTRDGSAVSLGRDGEAVETLRRRLARMAFDVHDGPMQELIALGFGLQQLRSKAVAGSPENAEHLSSAFDQFHSRLSETEQLLRSMMSTLETAASEPTAISEIVEEQVAVFRDRCPEVAVEVSVVGDLELHTDSQRIALDRVLRESLTNIAKHANAGKVTVRLHGLSDVLVVQICDDGCGFEPETLSTRIGLTAMKDRLEMIDGQLTIESRAGGPTTTTATIQRWRPAAA
jgi:two-component system NarL family sensor kinase